MSVLKCVARRDLFRRMRHPRFYHRRMLFAALAGLVALGVFLHAALVRATAAGLWAFSTVAFLMLGAACVVAPWSGASTVAQEKEDRTLGLLLLSDVRPVEVVLGKWFGPAFATAMVVLSGLPLLALCAGEGGIHVSQVVGGVAILLSTICMGSCMGVAMSAVMPTVRTALGGAVVGIGGLFIALPDVVSGLGGLLSTGTAARTRLLQAASPFVAMEGVMGGSLLPAAWNCLFGVMASAVFLGAAALAVPRFGREEERWAMAAASRRGGIRAAAGNPVAWKEQFRTLRPRCRWLLGTLTAEVGFLAGVSVTHGWGGLLGGVGTWSIDGWADGLVGAAWLSGLIAVAGAAITGVTAFAGEKRSRSLDLLLISGLTESEITMGKLWHAIRTFAPWMAWMAAAGLAEWWVRGEGALLARVLLLLAWASSVPAIAGVGLQASLVWRPVGAAGVAALFGVGGVAVLSAAAAGESLLGGFLVLINLAMLGATVGKCNYRLRQMSFGDPIW